MDIKDRNFIVSELINDEGWTPEEAVETLSQTKGFKIKELVDFWFSYGRRIYVYMSVKKPMGDKKLSSLSLITAEMYVESLVEAYEIKEGD